MTRFLCVNFPFFVAMFQKNSIFGNLKYQKYYYVYLEKKTIGAFTQRSVGY